MFTFSWKAPFEWKQQQRRKCEIGSEVEVLRAEVVLSVQRSADEVIIIRIKGEEKDILFPENLHDNY